MGDSGNPNAKQLRATPVKPNGSLTSLESKICGEVEKTDMTVGGAAQTLDGNLIPDH